MPGMPEIRARELVQQMAVIPASDAGAGLRALGVGLGNAAAAVSAEEDRQRRVAENAYLANLEVDNREKLAVMAAESRDNPERFSEVAKGHIEGVLSQIPDKTLRMRAEPVLRGTAATQFQTIVNRKATQDRAVQGDALVSNRDYYMGSWMGLSDAGQGASPAAQDARTRAIAQLDAMVEGGFISRDHADNMISDKEDEAQGRSILAFNKGTFQRSGFGVAWNELDQFFGPDTQIRNPALRAKLLNQGQEYLREQVAASARVDALAEKEVRRREEETAKAGWALYDKRDADGNRALNADWIEKNRTNLSLAEYKSLKRAVGKAEAEFDNLAVYDDFERAIFAGEDVTRPIVKAQESGYLKTETARTLIQRNREHLAKAEPENPYQMSLKNLSESLDPGPLVQDPAARRRKADAVEMFKREFLDENTRREKAGKSPLSPAETFALRDEIRDRFQLINWDESTVSLPLPKFFVGTRQSPNIDATEAAIAQALRSGRLSQPEAEREAQIIEKWRAAIAKRPPEPEKKRK